MKRGKADPDNCAEPILVEGRNCWRIARAERLSFLIDAAAYFRAFKGAAMRARRSILIVGWDVHSRMQLEFPDKAAPDVPNELGPFLEYLVRRREKLEIRVLDWDSPLLYAPERELIPKARFDWFTHPRLQFALDDEHPVGASQHQKLAVIDDGMAFVGGIDLTAERLDDPEHRPNDPRRREPDGKLYGPHHDVQLGLSGPVAAALGEVARDRWLRATEERLEPVANGADCWPDDFAADLAEVDVAVARTYPAWKERPEVQEIETLFVDSFNRAKHSIYVENQYLTARPIARALLDRLAEPDCPEIVLVVPQHPADWLERTTMRARQRCIIARLRNADAHERLRVYSPFVGESGDVAIKVHAKVMVADGCFMHVGSANLNNRSMGFDSECDVAVEGDGDSGTAKAITEFRNRLLAEHLDVSPERVGQEIEAQGSLIGVIEALRGPGRSLLPFPEESPDEIDTLLAEADFLDPEMPAEPERLADELVSRESGRKRLRSGYLHLGAIVFALIGLALLWRWGPFSDFAEVSYLVQWSAALRDGWTLISVMLAAYLVGGLLVFPVTVLVAVTGLIFDPLTGLLVAGAGSMLSALAGYGAGALLGRKTLHKLSGERLDRISRQLARRGVLSVALVRLLPVAPFTLVNMAAGASHISLRDFVWGTVLGMAPGIAAITLFAGQLVEVLRSPSALNFGILAGILLVMAGAAIWSWDRFVRHRPEQESE